MLHRVAEWRGSVSLSQRRGDLEKIHGGKVHMGKTPVDGAATDRTRERAILSLRRKLQDAIRQENYELAASLRDELRRAEEGEEAGA